MIVGNVGGARRCAGLHARWRGTRDEHGPERRRLSAYARNQRPMVRLFADPACNLTAGPVGLGIGPLRHADCDECARSFRAGRALGDMAIAGAAVSRAASLHLPADHAQAVERRGAKEQVGSDRGHGRKSDGRLAGIAGCEVQGRCLFHAAIDLPDAEADHHQHGERDDDGRDQGDAHGARGGIGQGVHGLDA